MTGSKHADGACRNAFSNGIAETGSKSTNHISSGLSNLESDRLSDKATASSATGTGISQLIFAAVAFALIFVERVSCSPPCLFSQVFWMGS